MYAIRSYYAVKLTETTISYSPSVGKSAGVENSKYSLAIGARVVGKPSTTGVPPFIV